MKLIFIFVISIFLTQPSFAKWGKGQLKLTPDIMEHVMMYMYGAGNPKYSGDDKKKMIQILLQFLKMENIHSISIVHLSIELVEDVCKLGSLDKQF